MTQGFTPVVPAVASLIFYISILLVIAAAVFEYRKLHAENEA
jgi:ABC-type spermidine/putrescine transport system permease subunit II